MMCDEIAFECETATQSQLGLVLRTAGPGCPNIVDNQSAPNSIHRWKFPPFSDATDSSLHSPIGVQLAAQGYWEIVLTQRTSHDVCWFIERYIFSSNDSVMIYQYSDVIMSELAPQITGVSIVCWNVCSGANHRKRPKLRVTELREGNLPMTGGFPSQRASNTENASIWWRHHVLDFFF